MKGWFDHIASGAREHLGALGCFSSMTAIGSFHTEPPPPVTKRSVRWLWPALILAALGALGLVGYIVDEITEGASFRLDDALLLALRKPGHPNIPIGPVWLMQSAVDLSALGGFTLQWLLGGAACVFLVLIRRRAEAAWLAGSVIGASLVNTAMKSLMHRPRPELVPHLAVVSNASFPSGHAMISAAIYLTIGAMLAETQPLRRTRFFLMSFAGFIVLMVGCSRIYLGVHWPSDVLAGWCLGSVWALVAFGANRTVRRRVAARKLRAGGPTSPA